MAKHSTNSKSTQALHISHSAHVELPLPMLSALEDIDRAFFGVCVEAGKQVLGAMMEHDRTALCGLPWKPDEERPGRRAGSTESPVTLGGRRIAIRRPRVRSIEGEELGLPSFEAATDRDPLDDRAALPRQQYVRQQPGSRFGGGNTIALNNRGCPKGCDLER